MLRLMIVDDEEIIRNALSRLIDYKSLGYELVAVARNGMEAYDIICEEDLDVVITDIRMPLLNGLELIERAKKIDEKLEFVILSGYGEFEYAKQAIKYGVKEYILKPTDKSQLEDALKDIKCKKEKEMRVYQEKIKEQMAELRQPIERAFLMEGLQSATFHDVFHKYCGLLSMPNVNSSVLFCYFVEEKNRSKCVRHIERVMDRLGIRLLFPAIAVTGSMLFVTSFMNVVSQKKIKEEIEDWCMEEKIPEILTEFVENETLEPLLENVFQKISRYREVYLCDQQARFHKISNTVNSSWNLGRLKEMAEQGEDISVLVEAILKNNQMGINEMRSIAFDIYMYFNDNVDVLSIESSCNFLRKVYACNNLDELLNLTWVNNSLVSKKRNNIDLLKDYVKTHLSEENLSLKWIAENYLFTNVQYLSKQFVKEEGERFSDYLTRERMEKAKELLSVYNNDNVKDIAQIVGFGNNPRYFSQVFKKYVGCLPSEYVIK